MSINDAAACKKALALGHCVPSAFCLETASLPVHSVSSIKCPWIVVIHVITILFIHNSNKMVKLLIFF